MRNRIENILTEKFSKILLILGALILLIGALLFIWNDWHFSASEKIRSDKIGQFGDFVGGFIGSIWALAGVILFYIALKEQRKDFETNRKVLNAQTDALTQQIREFELQREELAETREIFKIQSDTLKIQQFESTFFNLLQLHHNIVNAIDLSSLVDKYPGFEKLKVRGGNKHEKIVEITTGRDCFVKFRNGFKNTYSSNMIAANWNDEYALVNQSYKDYYSRHQSDLSHYFRSLYHIFKFVNNSEIDNKKRYTSLVRAQLSNDELFLLFYNCISDLGKEKFKILIEEFQLLKNLDTSGFIEENKHSLFYKKSAYG